MDILVKACRAKDVPILTENGADAPENLDSISAIRQEVSIRD